MKFNWIWDEMNKMAMITGKAKPLDLSQYNCLLSSSVIGNKTSSIAFGPLSIFVAK